MEIIKRGVKNVMNEKGQMFQGIMKLFMGLILLVAFLPATNSLVSSAIGSNMSDLLMVDVIRLLLGLAGLLMVALWIMDVFNPQTPSPPQYYR